MKLNVGERLTATGPASQPGGYVVTGVVSETPWCGLYSGKKIFYNFDFTAKRPRETDDKEWLDVLLRTIHYPVLDDATYVAGRRSLARAEVRLILGSRSSNLWPEPLDLLEVANTRDPFTFTAPANGEAEEPIVVFAHPHGQLLSKWQEGVLPLASILGVLAEVLEFMRLAHAGGLVLNGLGPDAIIVDRANRVHYVGSDMVHAGIEPALSREQWQRLYPAHRYAHGFAAPECFDLSRLPDSHSDLYAWGALAFHLLTGERPGQIAQEQGQPWAHFRERHLASMERSLRGVPPAHVRNWAEELGVSGDALVADWPHNILTAIRLLLHPDRRRRPASVAEFRTWVLSPPPPPLAGALALRAPGGQAHVYVDVGENPAGLEMVVRRQAHQPPQNPDEGELVREGPVTPRFEAAVPSSSGPQWFSLFTRQSRPGGATSIATAAELIEPRPEEILRLVEPAAFAGLDAPEPSAVRLLFEALDEAQAAEVLLGSRLVPVRGWALQRLETSHARDSAGPAEPLLWHSLQDPAPQLRLQAAQALLGNGQVRDENLVHRLAGALGGSDLDECIQAAQSLRQLGVEDDLIQRTIVRFEGDRPTTCPVCQVELAGRDRPAHLREFHHYVDVFGTLLPYAVALERLWDRVFKQGDAQAHDQLLETLAPDADGAGTQGYFMALEDELERRAAMPNGPAGSGTPQSPVENLISCLRRSARAAALVPDFLRSKTAQVREVGRELLLPRLAAELREVSPTVADLRRQLDRACPEDLLEEKILLCLRLPQLGIDLATADACLARLQDERPMLCPECQARIRVIDLESHLRRAHGIFEFRGVRRSYADTRATLLSAVCGSSPDYAAWAALEAITRERYGTQTEARLASWLGQTLRSLEREQRTRATRPLAEVIARSDCAGALVHWLVEPQRSPAVQLLSRLLAMEIVARLPSPMTDDIVEGVQPLLGDKQVSRSARHAAVASILRTTGKSGPAARAVLEAFIGDSGKLRSIEKLHLLEQFVGQAPAIDSLCAELEDQLRMNCPRCATQLRRAQMALHLWDRHRLVLEGRRVREPWRMIEDWLEDYRLERDAAVLERCRDLARKLDPQNGLREVRRLVLRHGVEDREALTSLLDQARAGGTCLCPHCFALIPVTEIAAPPPLEFVGNSLEGEGYRIELFEQGLVPRLEIEGPAGMLHDGREPGRWLTRTGGLATIVSPVVLLTFFLTEFFTSRSLPLPIVIALALGAGLFLGGLLYLLWPVSLNLRDRLVDWAWNILVPALCEEGLSAGSASFSAGLAQVSAGVGDSAARAESVETAREALDKLARHDAVFVPHLAALWRVTAEDDAEDPVAILAEQVGRCFTAQLPLVYATHLLADLDRPRGHGKESTWWNKGQACRLQVLLCEQAFNAGLELADLLDIGHANPVLGAVLIVEDVEYLSQLRLLWSLRSNRPWERLSTAMTVFEAAAKPHLGGKLLTSYPELLLAVDGTPLFLCSHGACFEEVVFHHIPTSVEVRTRAKGGFDLVLGSNHFRFSEDPEPLAVRLEKWFRYYFREFKPQVAAVHDWRSSDASRKLQARNGVPCPQCRKKVVTRPGDVGITLDAKVLTTWI